VKYVCPLCAKESATRDDFHSHLENQHSLNIRTENFVLPDVNGKIKGTRRIG
jgi:hypothetical protein